MQWIDGLVVLVLVLGGLNAGLVGFLGWNPVEEALGPDHPLLRTVYRIVGLCAVYLLVKWPWIRRRWDAAPL